MKHSVVFPFVTLLLLLGRAAETTATVVGSSDVCTSWTEIPLPPGFDSLSNDTSFEIWADASRFLVLADGELFYSEDIGVSWTAITGPAEITHFNVNAERLLYSSISTPTTSTDVYQVDGDWTSGTHSPFITMPGAYVSQICSHGDFVIIPAIKFDKSDTAEAKTYFTGDGGATWWNLYFTRPSFRCAIDAKGLNVNVAAKMEYDFLDTSGLPGPAANRLEPFAVDGILSTEDGGKTWETINFYTKSLDLLILPEVSYAIKEDGSGLYTTGNKWFSNAKLESSVGGLPEGLNAVVGSGATAFVSSRDVSFEGILTTPDKGVTWNKLTGPVTTDTEIGTSALYFDESSTKLHSMWYSDASSKWRYYTAVCEVNAS